MEQIHRIADEFVPHDAIDIESADVANSFGKVNVRQVQYGDSIWHVLGSHKCMPVHTEK